MKIIVPAIDTFVKLSKNQKKTENVAYRPSTFCVSLPCIDGNLVYNTLSGEMILLEQNENWYNNSDYLIQNWFLVPESFDEYSYARQIRNISSLLNRKNKKTTFLILTTTDCNARCFYCYEKGCQKISMTEETAIDVADYIIKASGDELLKLTWFGGEPMLNHNAIDVICSKLKETGKSFISTMISNGYYFTPEIATIGVNDWNLRSLQITIDGTKDVYLNTKAYIENDSNAYERVIRNIKSASEGGLSIIIRMNMNRHNADDLFDLADELKVSLEGCGGITGQSALLQEITGKVGLFFSDEEAAKKSWELQKKLDKQWPIINHKLLRGIRINTCIADNDACEVIMPDGNIGRCTTIDQQNVVGNIYSDYRDEIRIKEWKEQVSFPECKTCPLYPQCIKLKKCNCENKRCSKSERLINLWRIEEQMLADYKTYCEKRN